MFRNVGTAMNDTQSTLNMAANLDRVSKLLHSDLKNVYTRVSYPAELAAGATYDNYGYLEIIEGMGRPVDMISNGKHRLRSEIFVNSELTTNNEDNTPGDVDDILIFTAKNEEFPFWHETDPIQESTVAEIAWFIRGNKLYRRINLVNDGVYTGTDVKTPVELARRENRVFHSKNPFPYPLYTSDNGAWYFLGLPIQDDDGAYATSFDPLGTSLGGANSVSTFNNISISTAPYRDLWLQPNTFTGTGWKQDSASGAVIPTNGSTNATGEDIILNNVISFDVKVWNPYWVPCVSAGGNQGNTASSGNANLWLPPQFVDLGQDYFFDLNGNKYDVNYQQSFANNDIPTDVRNNKVGFGFTLKGRYSSFSQYRSYPDADNPDDESKKELLSDGETGTAGSESNTTTRWSGTPMPCVYCTWNRKYEFDDNGSGKNKHRNIDLNRTTWSATDMTTWACPPPYTDKMEAVQVTIRCFDPASGNIRQIRVVHRFTE